MENVLPRDAYRRDVSVRIRHYTLLFGMAQAALLYLGTPLLEQPTRLLLAGGAALLGCLCFAVIARDWHVTLLERLYAANPASEAPLQHAGYVSRLLCRRRLTPLFSVPGVLYLGREGARFEPRRGYWLWSRPVQTRDLASIVFVLTAERLRQARVATGVLEMHWATRGCASFITPEPEHVLRRLKHRLRELRRYW